MIPYDYGFAIIYEHGPEEMPLEEYYEVFSSPHEAKIMWALFTKATDEKYRNARLVKIICPMEEVE